MRTDRSRTARRAAAALTGVALLAAGCILRPPPSTGGGTWVMSGHDAHNSRSAEGERAISPATAGSLKLQWSIDTAGDVSATPSVADGVVYFPDFGGYLTAADAHTGAVKWKKRVADYTGNPLSQVRNTPVVSEDLLIVGEIKHHTHAAEAEDARAAVDALADDHDDHDEHDHGVPTTTTTSPGTTGPTGTAPAGEHDHGAPPAATGAHLLGINRQTGALVWTTTVDPHPAAVITSNPVLVGSKVVAGVSSLEEGLAASGAYTCCTFRGSVVKLDARTGRLEWQTQTLPADPTGAACQRYDAATQEFGGCPDSGAAVWNTPAVDVLTNTVYAGTGNNYTVTDAEWQCARDARAANKPDDTCTSPDNHLESVLALDLVTGRIKWTRKLGGFDAWNYNCLVNPGNTWCPSPYGEDFDFGSNTNLFTATVNGRPRQLVGIGQKSGIYWALDARTGAVVWSTLVGPGSALGGIEWGSAFDHQRIYVANANFKDQEWKLPSGETSTAGSWSALDPDTGRILWQTPNPVAAPKSGPLGATTVANGVVFGGTVQGNGTDDNMFALDAATGKVLWRFAAAGSVNSGPSVVDGTVFWGAGYEDMAASGMTTARKLYAFSVGSS